jgi:hypothetical protein
MLLLTYPYFGGTFLLRSFSSFSFDLMYFERRLLHYLSIVGPHIPQGSQQFPGSQQIAKRKVKGTTFR